MMLYRHRKSGRTYRWLAAGIDCTNSRDGTPVVIYCPDDNEHTIYVREQSEFNAGFEAIDPPPGGTQNGTQPGTDNVSD